MKPRAIIIVLLLLLLLWGGHWWYSGWREDSQDAPILAAAKHYNVPPALVKAVVWRESRFDPEARGSRGEIGLMQIIPAAAAKDWSEAEHVSLSDDQLLDPATNTLVGTWYLKKLLKRYVATDNPLPYALADYNAGRGNVLKWNQGAAVSNSTLFLEQITFPSTRSYIEAITGRYRHYRPIFPPKHEQ